METNRIAAKQPPQKRPAPTLDLSGDACAVGCFAFRTQAALRKISGLHWSVAHDGSAYVATGDGVLLEALAAYMRQHLHHSVPNKEGAIWISGDKKPSSTLHIARFACETGDFVGKLLAEHEKDTQPTLGHAGFMTALCIEQLERLTPYHFSHVADNHHPDKRACAKAVINADSARGLQAALQQHAGIATEVRPVPARENTPQRDQKAELVLHGSRMALEQLKALRNNPDFKTAFDYGVLDHVAKATSASRPR